MIAKSNLILVAVTAACAGLGFLAGRGLGGRADSEPLVRQSGKALEDSRPRAKEAVQPVELPRADAAAAEDFQRFVAKLADAGDLDDDFAQWLGLVLLAREDLRTSMEIARREDLLEAWAGGAGLLDPESSIELLRPLPRRERETPLHVLISTLGRTDPERGVALLEELPASLRPDAFGLFQNWAGQSVSEAATAAGALGDEHMRTRALAGVFHVWGLQDRRGMLEWAIERGTGVGRQAFFAAYEGNGFRDPELALEFAQEHPEIASWNMLVAMADGLVDKGAHGWDAILDLPPGALRAELLMRGATAQTRKDPAEALRICLSLPPEDQQLFLRLSAVELGRTDPRGIADLLHRLAPMGDLSPRGILNQWAESDAPAALEWSHANLRGLDRLRAIGGIFSSWMARDPGQAIRALDTLPPGARANLLPEMARTWSENAPAEALEWANKLPALDRTRALDEVIAGWSRRDPVKAAAALRDLSPDGLENAYRAVAMNLAQTKPTEAARWAEDLDTPYLQTRAIEGVTSAWSRQDAAAASEYLSGLQRGDYRDAAVTGFVRSVAELDPAVAVEWAETVDNPLRRRDGIRLAVPILKARNPAAARALIKGLSDRALREEMLKLVEEIP